MKVGAAFTAVVAAAAVAPSLAVPSGYTYSADKCVPGHNGHIFYRKSVQWCANKCDQYAACKAFEYGTGSRSRECRLQTAGTPLNACGQYNLDVYVKDVAPIVTINPGPTPPDYTHHPNACVLGENIQSSTQPFPIRLQTLEECAAICNADNQCQGFEYGTARSSWGVEKFDCRPQSGRSMSNCNPSNTLDMYVKSVPLPPPVVAGPPPTNYNHLANACVIGSNIQIVDNKSLQDCADMCDAESRCAAFEYGTANSGSIKENQCRLQDSAKMEGCDGTNKLDMYIKIPTAPYTTFDYDTTLTGTESCAVVSVVMDESGSMDTEQSFMKDVAMGQIAQRLDDRGIENVFVCVFVYGSDRRGNYNGPHLLGCSEGFDANNMDWHTDGYEEDAFEALTFAMTGLPATINNKDLSTTCAGMGKNVILVTDEDSDPTNSYFKEDTLALALKLGYTVNIVGNFQFHENSAVGITPDGSLLKIGGDVIPSPKGGAVLEIKGGAGYSEVEYPPVAFGSKGAIWNLNKLRVGGDAAMWFTRHFINTKVGEVVNHPEVINIIKKGSGKKTQPPCGTKCARFSGDPHYRTFDKLSYDCQAKGEMLIAETGDFTVHGRLMAGSSGWPVTVTKAVAFRAAGGDDIQVSVPEDNSATTCTFSYFKNGQPVTLADLDSSDLSNNGNSQKPTFVHEESGSSITMGVRRSSRNGCVMWTSLCIPGCDAEDNYGLFGTNDGNRLSDWTIQEPDPVAGTDTTMLPVPVGNRWALRGQPAFDFCLNYCVPEAESMFTHTYGVAPYGDFAHYNIDCPETVGGTPGTYDNSLEANLKNVDPKIKAVCSMDPACTIDGVVGTEADAEAYKEVQAEMDETDNEQGAGLTECYDYHADACVLSSNIRPFYPMKTPVECAALCDANDACVAFEYATDAYSGNSLQIAKNECRLQTSSDQSGCDGGHYNLDLYVKKAECKKGSGKTTGGTCKTKCARFSGDPHFKTFDRLRYDCQGKGEFHVAKTGAFDVQGRFMVGQTTRPVTVTKGVAFTYPGGPKIQASVQEDPFAKSCSISYYLDGSPVSLSDLASLELSAGGSANKPVFIHEASGSILSLGFKVSSWNGCVMWTSLCIPGCDDSTLGLFGTNTGDKLDDWTIPDLTELPVPVNNRWALRRKPAFDYCINWCVKQSDSLFKYGGSFGDFASYNIDCPATPADPPGDYDDSMDNDVENPPQDVVDVCGPGDQNLGCTTDGVAGGVGDAEDFNDTEEEIDDIEDDVGAPNNPPVAQDDTSTTSEDAEVDVPILGNDSDPDDDDLTVKSTGPCVLGGTLSLGGKYSPPAGTCDNTDTCPYTITDGTVAEASATVTITITCLPNNAPVAVDDSVTTLQDDTITVPVLTNDNDPDGDDLTVTSTGTCASGGTMTTSGTDVSYTPPAGTCDIVDTCEYTISDGADTDSANVIVKVECLPNNPPVAVDDVETTVQDTEVDVPILDNDTDQDGDDLTVTQVATCTEGGSMTMSGRYSPPAGVCDIQDTCAYVISDGEGGIGGATVTVTVNCPPNDPPVAQDDSATTQVLTNVDVPILDNDSDPDGDDLTVTDTGTCSSGGSLSMSGTYTTPLESCGLIDTCTYTISDGSLTDTATVSITVDCIPNNPPTPEDDSATAPQGDKVDVPILDNDTDPDGDILAVSDTGDCTSGGVLTTGGEYTAPSNVCDVVDTCTYTVSDGTDEATATVSVTIECPPTTTAAATTVAATTGGASVKGGGGPGKTDPGASGDPHFKTWVGENYDYHGVCDLVLLSNQAFHNNMGMDIHIRTKKMKQWSYISNAVVRIGEDTFELKGGKDGSFSYWVNGVEGEELYDDGSDGYQTTEHAISDYPIKHKYLNAKQRQFMIDLGNGESIVMKTWKELVRVDIEGATEASFGRSLGMMGTFTEGKKLARDNSTVIEDLNSFGEEWQVLATEPKLFHNFEGPQPPMKCHLPVAKEARRRLREGTITQKEAEVACARVSASDRDLCIFDVMATNDLDVAGAY